MPARAGLLSPTPAAFPPVAGLECYGHSYTLGQGVLTLDRRWTSVLAAMIGAYEVNFGVGGAAVSWDEASTRPGGFVNVMKNLLRPRTVAPYLPASDVVSIQYGINDIAEGIAQATISHAFRAVLCRARASSVKEETDASVTLAGATWGTNSGANNSSGGANKSATTNGATISLALPSDYPGNAEIAVHFLSFNAGGGTWTVTSVDGGAPASAQNVSITNSGLQGTTGRVVPTVLRIPGTGLAAGAHTIVLTLSAVSGTAFFDGWSIQATTPPMVLLHTQPRCPSYSAYSGSPHVPTDADVVSFNSALQSVAAEFDSYVQVVDADPLLNKDSSLFYTDSLHPNEEGHAVIAGAAYDVLTQRARLSARAARGAKGRDAWHQVGTGSEPAFANSWVNVGGTFDNAAFRRGPDGKVTLKGVIKTGTLNTAAFTLPLAYRPAKNKLFATSGNTGSAEAACLLRVNSDGTVVPVSGTNANFALEGVSFYTD